MCLFHYKFQGKPIKQYIRKSFIDSNKMHMSIFESSSHKKNYRPFQKLTTGAFTSIEFDQILMLRLEKFKMDLSYILS